MICFSIFYFDMTVLSQDALKKKMFYAKSETYIIEQDSWKYDEENKFWKYRNGLDVF